MCNIIMLHMRKKRHATHVHVWKKNRVTNHVTRKHIVLYISGKEWCYTYGWVASLLKWVISHLQMSHVTRMNESRDMSDILHLNGASKKESHYTERLVFHLWKGHVALTMSHVTYSIPFVRGEHQKKRATVATETLRGGIFALPPTKKKKNQPPNDESVASHVLDLCERALIFPKRRPLRSGTQERASEWEVSCSYAYRFCRSFSAKEPYN